MFAGAAPVVGLIWVRFVWNDGVGVEREMVSDLENGLADLVFVWGAGLVVLGIAFAVTVLPYVMIRDLFRERRGRCACGASNSLPPGTHCWRCHEPLGS